MEGCREGESLQKDLLTKSSTSVPNCASGTRKQIGGFRQGLMGAAVQPTVFTGGEAVCQIVGVGSSPRPSVSAGEAFADLEQICMICFIHDKMISEIEQNNLWSHSLFLLAYPH